MSDGTGRGETLLGGVCVAAPGTHRVCRGPAAGPGFVSYPAGPEQTAVRGEAVTQQEGATLHADPARESRDRRAVTENNTHPKYGGRAVRNGAGKDNRGSPRIRDRNSPAHVDGQMPVTAPLVGHIRQDGHDIFSPVHPLWTLATADREGGLDIAPRPVPEVTRYSCRNRPRPSEPRHRTGRRTSHRRRPR